MVVKRQCSFCAAEIEPGTGAMYVKKDGTIYHFDTGSCRKQQLNLGRVGHRLKWTRAHALKRAADRSAATARALPRAETSLSKGPGRSRRAPAPAPPAPPAAEAPKPAPTTPVEVAPKGAAPPAKEEAESPAAPAKKAAKPRTRAKKSADDAPVASDK